MIFDKKIQQEFKNKQPIEILEKYLYKYRDNVHNDNFHFLIGLCFLKMGYLREAKIAFEKAIFENPENIRNKIFLSNTFVQAQHFKEADEMVNNLDKNKMTASELLAFMEVKKYLNKPIQEEKELILKDIKENLIDKKVFSIFAYAFCNEYEQANKLASEIQYKELANATTFFLLMEEFYKLNISKEIIVNLFDQFVDNYMTKVKQNELEVFLKSAFGCNYLEICDKTKQSYIFNYIQHKYSKNLELVSQILILKYNLAEKLNDKEQMAKAIKSLNSLKKKNEQVLLCLVTDSFKNFENANRNKLKKRIEQLIEKDQQNEKYRKLYFDLLIKLNQLSEAEKLTRATITMTTKKEKKVFDIIHSFYSFYYLKKCLFTDNPKHDDNCPLCFGTTYMPIVKTMMFAHNPRQIYTEDKVSKVIEVNEKTLKAIVDWQPMNIPSQIVGTYLQSLGAYETRHDIPDVLVPGQTYIFLKMKTETYKRLAKEGYSLEQIDPYVTISQAIQRTNMSKVNELFSKENKPINIDNLPVTAEDFVLEIIYAKTKEE